MPQDGLNRTAAYVLSHGRFHPTGFEKIEIWENLPKSWVGALKEWKSVIPILSVSVVSDAESRPIGLSPSGPPTTVLPPADPTLERLALNDADERVRRRAFERMEAEAQLRLVGVVQAGDESFLAGCIGANLDDQVLSSGDVVAHLISAPASFRIALIAHAKSEPLAIALTETLDNDADRGEVVHGKGAIGARAGEIDTARETAGDASLQFDKTLSSQQDLDYASALSQLTQQKVSLEAAQKSFIQVQQLSLFQYL
jgi:hypothetical protein